MPLLPKNFNIVIIDTNKNVLFNSFIFQNKNIASSLTTSTFTVTLNLKFSKPKGTQVVGSETARTTSEILFSV